MQHINRLPSLVFRLIFSKLTFHDLLTVGRVCALWKEYQMEITRKVHSMTLLIGYELRCDTYSLTPLYLIAESPFTLSHSNELLNELQEGPLFEQPQPSPSLTIPYLYVSTVNKLVESLPNVRTLNISINGIPCHVIKRVIYLLKQWKHKLVTFKLYCYFYDKYSQSSEPYNNLHVIPKLFESLNALSSQLEHVTLDLNRYSRYLEDKCDFSFLARISEFNYTFNASAYQVPKWLTQHGNSNNNTRLERIGLGGWDGRLVRELSKNPELASKITVLPKFSTHDIQYYTKLNAFTNLASFEVHFKPQNATFADVFKPLSYLKNLIRLHIIFPACPSLAEFNLVSTDALAQLPSVKLLSLDASCVYRHSALESPHWGWILPNVQILSVKHCSIGTDRQGQIFVKCPNLVLEGRVTREKVGVGMRALVSTFEQCPSLHRIYLNENLDKNPEDGDDLVKFRFDL